MARQGDDALDDPRFARAVQAVLDSYQSLGGINHLEGANLPSRERVIEAWSHFEKVLFPGFYDRERIDRLNVRYAIGQRLALVVRSLSAEFEKALLYEIRATGGGASAVSARDRAEVRAQSSELSMALVEAMPELRAVLHTDARAALRGDPAARSFVDVVLSYPSLRAIAAYRVAHYLHIKGIPLIPRMMSEHIHGLTGIDIHPGARVGSGLFIDHGTGVVVGETAVLGDDVKLYQGVTLGALSVARDPAGEWSTEQRHPTIGNRVTIYAGATILGGGTTVGEDCIIGGNVWLTRSVPPRTKVLLDPPFLVYQSAEDGQIRRERLTDENGGRDRA